MQKLIPQFRLVFLLLLQTYPYAEIATTDADFDPLVEIMEPQCPLGNDTTYLICPHYDHCNNLLSRFDLPIGGTWESPLQDTSGNIYNSCNDGTSLYIYPS